MVRERRAQEAPRQEEASANDYALERVPLRARTPWMGMATQRFGQLASLGQFMLGAMLGANMEFWASIAVLVIGTVLLELVAIWIGVAGMREGMSTSVLARWTGFGNKGAAIIGLIIVISLTGWFGVQNGVFATAMNKVVPGIPGGVWSFVGGAVLTLLAWRGFKLMTKVAAITAPAFVLLITGIVIFQLVKHPIGEIIAAPIVGQQPMSIFQGITAVVGIFIIGAVMAPDMTRFSRNRSDVIKQTVVGVTAGSFFTGLAGILLARVARSAEPVTIIMQTGGMLGVVVILASIININTWNLYGASLGTVGAFDTLLRKAPSRGVATMVLGALGSVLSAVGVANSFGDFLSLLSVLFPPIGGIIIADYFLVKSWRRELMQVSGPGHLPPWAPQWIPTGLVVWIVAAALGFISEKMGIGISTVTSFIAGFGLFCLSGIFNLNDIGLGSTYTPKRSLDNRR